MNQNKKKCVNIIFIHTNEHFIVNNSKLLYVKALYKRHSNHIKIDISIAIVLYNLNHSDILLLFFE